jgi:hypothetical protein
MTITRTTLLDLPIITSGTETGTWGDIVNNGLTQYLDIAVAGMVSLTSSDFTAGALTIALTEGTSGATNIANSSAQYATIKVSSLAQNSTITAPASNRSYRIVNADSTYSLTIKASGQTGITFLPGQTGVVAFTGTDYEVVGVVNAASSTDNAVPKFDGTTGQIIQNTGVTIDDSNVVGGITQLNVDNLRLDGNAITSTNSNGNIALTPNGTGEVDISKVDIDSGTIDGTAIGGSTPAAGSFTTLNTSGAVVFNDAGADVDFRVEGDTDANLLFVDASADKIGIGTSSPAQKLDIQGNGNQTMLITRSDPSVAGGVEITSGSSANQIGNPTSKPLLFITNATERMRIDSSGNVGIGTSDPTSRLQVAGGIVDRGTTLVGGVQTYADFGENAVTATTGTIVFKFKGLSPGQAGRAIFVKLSVTTRRTTNNQAPMAEYWFQLWHNSSGTVALVNATTIFEVDFVRATHFAFANLGNGECTITLTNPTAATLQSVGYKVEMLSSSIRWVLDSVSYT